MTRTHRPIGTNDGGAEEDAVVVRNASILERGLKAGVGGDAAWHDNAADR